MANEGSTKPTYEELEIAFNRVNDECERVCEKLEGENEELARVRGLLQLAYRYWIPEGTELHTEVRAELAESADIGKLDAADEEPNVYDDLARHFRGRINVTYSPEQVARTIEDLRDRKIVKLGSAETGGEKA